MIKISLMGSGGKVSSTDGLMFQLKFQVCSWNSLSTKVCFLEGRVCSGVGGRCGGCQCTPPECGIMMGLIENIHQRNVRKSARS